jgi:hypothetical protein
MWYCLELAFTVALHLPQIYSCHAAKQGVAGNKKGEFEVEDQFIRKLHTNNG